jgi:drug/metabolite transporter (DMT)-like permease
LKVAKGNSLMYLKPLIAGTLAWMMIDEHLTAARIASAILISVSIYFVLRGQSLVEAFSGEEKTKP